MAIDARFLPVIISLLVVLAIGAAIAVSFQPFGRILEACQDIVDS